MTYCAGIPAFCKLENPYTLLVKAVSFLFRS